MYHHPGLTLAGLQHLLLDCQVHQCILVPMQNHAELPVNTAYMQPTQHAISVISCSLLPMQYVITHCFQFGLSMSLSADGLASCAPAPLFCTAGQCQW